MTDPVAWSTIFPLLATMFGALASALMGMSIAKLNNIEKNQQELNSKVFAHLTQQGIHESAVVKIDERIANLLQVSQAIHARVDRIESH